MRLVDYGDHAKELFDRARCQAEGFKESGNTWVKGGRARLLPVYESKYVNMCLLAVGSG